MERLDVRISHFQQTAQDGVVSQKARVARHVEKGLECKPAAGVIDQHAALIRGMDAHSGNRFITLPIQDTSEASHAIAYIRELKLASCTWKGGRSSEWHLSLSP